MRLQELEVLHSTKAEALEENRETPIHIDISAKHPAHSEDHPQTSEILDDDAQIAALTPPE